VTNIQWGGACPCRSKHVNNNYLEQTKSPNTGNNNNCTVILNKINYDSVFIGYFLSSKDKAEQRIKHWLD